MLDSPPTSLRELALEAAVKSYTTASSRAPLTGWLTARHHWASLPLDLLADLEGEAGEQNLRKYHQYAFKCLCSYSRLSGHYFALSPFHADAQAFVELVIFSLNLLMVLWVWLFWEGCVPFISYVILSVHFVIVCTYYLLSIMHYIE
jgi:hypothetical protein